MNHFTKPRRERSITTPAPKRDSFNQLADMLRPEPLHPGVKWVHPRVESGANGTIKGLNALAESLERDGVGK